MKLKHEQKVAFREKEERSPASECRLFRIEGKVQGVWFRDSTRREAEPLGITGYAKNMADGSVQVLACGAPGSLDRLAEWLERGPPMAQVDQVEWIVTSRECPDSFETGQ